MKNEINISPTPEELEHAHETILAFVESIRLLIEDILDAYRRALEALKIALEPLARILAKLQLSAWRIPNTLAGLLSQNMPSSWAWRLAGVFLNAIE